MRNSRAALHQPWTGNWRAIGASLINARAGEQRLLQRRGSTSYTARIKRPTDETEQEENADADHILREKNWVKLLIRP